MDAPVANHDRLILTGRCAASVDDADVCEGHTSCVDALKDAWTRIDAACREGEGRSEDESERITVFTFLVSTSGDDGLRL